MFSDLDTPPFVPHAELTSAQLGKLEELRRQLRKLERVVVAFSGGVDSSVLSYVALETMGPSQVLAVTSRSPSLGAGELDHCESLASSWQLPWRSIATEEFSDPRYVANDSDRCYWCKSALMDKLAPIAEGLNSVVVLGVNVDDLSDHRPGQLAAAERSARFPLVEAGLEKGDVRHIARHLGLSVWDRPARPCLSSRIPYGTPVSVQILSRVDRAEAALRTMGFRDLRVRDYGLTARIEVPPADFAKACDSAKAIVDALTTAGYRYVTLDLAGLNSGNLNQSHSHHGQT